MLKLTKKQLSEIEWKQKAISNNDIIYEICEIPDLDISEFRFLVSLLTQKNLSHSKSKMQAACFAQDKERGLFTLNNILNSLKEKNIIFINGDKIEFIARKGYLPPFLGDIAITDALEKANQELNNIIQSDLPPEAKQKLLTLYTTYESIRSESSIHDLYRGLGIFPGKKDFSDKELDKILEKVDWDSFNPDISERSTF